MVKIEQGIENKLICSLCSLSTTSKNKLSDHVKAVHANIKQYKCDVCDRAFGQKENLNRHKLILHSRENLQKNKGNVCQQCGKGFTSKSFLRVHVEGVHLKVKKHKCEDCDSSFSIRSELVVHKRAVHLKLKPHPCHDCDAAFARGTHLKRHIANVHLRVKNFKCDECEKMFFRKDHLKVHRESVHTDTRRKDHACELCGSAFDIISGLREHYRKVHLKSHGCKTCGSTYSSRKQLDWHEIRVHLDIKAYKCHECGKEFGRKGILNSHLVCHKK